MSKTIKVLLGSVRSQRAGKTIADWVLNKGEENAVHLELLDLKEWNLPFFDEPVPPMTAESYAHESTRKWSQAIEEADGFIIVTPEYNHGYSPALKKCPGPSLQGMERQASRIRGLWRRRSSKRHKTTHSHSRVSGHETSNRADRHKPCLGSI